MLKPTLLYNNTDLKGAVKMHILYFLYFGCILCPLSLFLNDILPEVIIAKGTMVSTTMITLFFSEQFNCIDQGPDSI